jgi:UDP:flavonoid glycosyltransferase YjiC (YdhE family)
VLSRYVQEDRRVIDAFQPHLVVGDLRWSLAVSAPLSGVPHATLANAYWSPRAEDPSLPLPEHPMVRALGPRVAGACFPLARPFVFRHFAEPLNRLRRKHGLSPIGSLRDVVTYGDHTLFADTPRLAPLTALGSTEHYLGAVRWSPPGSLPRSWGRDPLRAPVYVTLGSSGDVEVLPSVLRALDGLPVDVLVATAGRYGGARPHGMHLVDYAPGDLAARRAALVITNGGSSTGYQALAEGTPVLGLPHNLDQYLAMKAIERVGAGRLVRSGAAAPGELRSTIEQCLGDETLRRGAAEARADLESLDAAKRFRAFVERMTATGTQRLAL